MKKTREIDIILGKNIVKFRLENGKNRKEMADAIGITHQQLQKYENGVNRISVARLFDIAKFLNVSPVKILNLDINYQESSEDEYKSLSYIIRHINKIKDERKIDTIKNLVKTLAISEVADNNYL